MFNRKLREVSGGRKGSSLIVFSLSPPGDIHCRGCFESPEHSHVVSIDVH